MLDHRDCSSAGAPPRVAPDRTAERALFARFETRKNAYVYDCYSNQILLLDRATWDLLEVVVAEREGTAPPPTVDLEALARARRSLELGVDAGYLRPCRIQTMRFPHVEGSIADRISGRIHQLTLELTQDCNLRCRYCLQARGRCQAPLRLPARMSMATAHKALGVFLTESRHSRERTVSFYGGEPLLGFDVLQAVVTSQDLHRARPQPSVRLTTNGLLLRGRIAEFLVQHQVHILVSLDGPKSVHDRNRPTAGGKGSFEVILANLRRLRQEHPLYYQSHVSFNCVLTPGATFGPVFEFFRGELFKGNHLEFSMVADLDDTDFFSSEGNYTARQWRELATQYDAAAVRSPGTGRRLLQQRLVHRFLPFALRPRSPLGQQIFPNGCCVPFLRKLYVAANGNIHLCENAAADNALGNVNRGGIDYVGVEQLVSTYCANSVIECRHCWAARLCSACYRDSLHNNAWQPARRAIVCARVRDSTLATLRDYTALLERHPEVVTLFAEARYDAPM